MLSANGSIMSRISSRTETSGLMSPSSGRAAGAVDGEGGADFEHRDHATTPRKISAARATRRPPRFIPSLPDYFGWIVAEPTRRRIWRLGGYVPRGATGAARLAPR